jgi:hypothetical protein
MVRHIILHVCIYLRDFAPSFSCLDWQEPNHLISVSFVNMDESSVLKTEL